MPRNMATGRGKWRCRQGRPTCAPNGDDIAQGLALMGVQPTWDRGSGRVTGFEIMPLDVLDRPRVDVTLRLYQGFFEMLSTQQIDLFDNAARAVAELDEPADKIRLPPASRKMPQRSSPMASARHRPPTRRSAGCSGPEPAPTGRGCRALIDERGWDTDISPAPIAWGGYAYGDGAEGGPNTGCSNAALDRCRQWSTTRTTANMTCSILMIITNSRVG